MNWQLPLVFRSKLDEAERLISHGAEQLRATTEQLEANAIMLNALNKQVFRLIEARQELDARHERDMVRSETRYAELMASYRTLRLSGHAEPVQPPKVPEQKVDPVLAAINAKAPDARTRAAMMRQVAIDRKADLSEEQIIMRINRGARPQDEIQ